jgi:DNA polymerase-1
MALNTRIQGSAADIIKIAMIRLQEKLEKNKMGAKLILQIHDELVVEAPFSEKDAVIILMKETMESAYPLDVPLTVDAGFGKNWREAH